LPFARSKSLILIFALQSSLLIPVAIAVRFLLAPIGLLIPLFHRWLKAPVFSMNPHYRRAVNEAMARKMRRWELVVVIAWFTLIGFVIGGAVPTRTPAIWFGRHC
jgi:hypothetical protein